MFTYLKLIRYQNLIFIALIQFVMRQVVLVPILQTFGFDASQDTGMLFLLMTASILIAAGGYVLNDYFDVKIDAINKPDKQIVGNIISRSSAMVIHQVLTGLGVICGLSLAYFTRSFTLAFIFIVIPGLLWFYSASYKRQFLIGNLVIAFISAITVLVVGIAQLSLLEKEFGSLIFETPIPSHFYGWIGGFALFSFLCTFIREIIKDMEDEKGDREMECRTLPIKLGMIKTKIILYCLIVLTVILLFVVNNYFIHFDGNLTIRYIIFGLALPFAVLGYLIYNAKSQTDFHQASNLSKVIMLIGVLYSFVFYYLQAKTFGISLFNIFILK
ncbi:MAG: geranylgeranylglycerol-phosphate geranylgeranyltransferase [Paludibacter sp.]|nr:geranylgeranylglycerol-phosphate geranylgeranyltransferase [Paludibacter sp.]